MILAACPVVIAALWQWFDKATTTSAYLDLIEDSAERGEVLLVTATLIATALVEASWGHSSLGRLVRGTMTAFLLITVGAWAGVSVGELSNDRIRDVSLALYSATVIVGLAGAVLSGIHETDELLLFNVDQK